MANAERPGLYLGGNQGDEGATTITGVASLNFPDGTTEYNVTGGTDDAMTFITGRPNLNFTGEFWHIDSALAAVIASGAATEFHGWINWELDDAAERSGMYQVTKGSTSSAQAASTYTLTFRYRGPIASGA